VIPRTRFVISSITLSGLLVAGVAAGFPDGFQPGKATDYSHQSSEQVTVGAKAYQTDELVVQAFGKKTDLLKYGVLPVLVVIENKRQKTLDMKDLEVSLVGADGRHVSAIDPDDIPFLKSQQSHSHSPEVPLPLPLPKKKNKLNAPEITARAFAAKMLPPGDSTSGFFYFEAKAEPGDKIYLNGLRDAPAGHDLMYFEFPLEQGQ
jgi:hypothetical protein